MIESICASSVRRLAFGAGEGDAIGRVGDAIGRVEDAIGRVGDALWVATEDRACWIADNRAAEPRAEGVRAAVDGTGEEGGRFRRSLGAGVIGFDGTLPGEGCTKREGEGKTGSWMRDCEAEEHGLSGNFEEVGVDKAGMESRSSGRSKTRESYSSSEGIVGLRLAPSGCGALKTSGSSARAGTPTLRLVPAVGTYVTPLMTNEGGTPEGDHAAWSG